MKTRTMQQFLSVFVRCRDVDWRDRTTERTVLELNERLLFQSSSLR